MSKSYPRISGSGEKNTHKECEACDKKAKYFAEVQYSYMRGDDEYIYLCHDHHQMIKTNTSKVIELAHNKSLALKAREIR